MPSVRIERGREQWRGGFQRGKNFNALKTKIVKSERGVGERIGLTQTGREGKVKLYSPRVKTNPAWKAREER